MRSTKKWKIVFMGTPEFVVPSLEALIKHENVIAVYTQPDRPKGRGLKIAAPPIKNIAIKYGIPCFQPKHLKGEEEFKRFTQLKPDLVVVANYGLFLPTPFLSKPKHKIINIHPSLLPKYRGASPIHWPLINGDTKTGITIIYVSPKMDSGDILMQKSIPINEHDTLDSLSKKLSKLGAKTLTQTIEHLKSNTITPKPQDETAAVIIPKITKAVGNIDWSKSAQDIYNLIRGANPWPGTYTHYQGETIKIHKAMVLSPDHSGVAGKIKSVSDDGIVVETPKGLLSLTEVQKPNKKRLPVAKFLKGNSITPGSFFSNKKS